MSQPDTLMPKTRLTPYKAPENKAAVLPQRIKRPKTRQLRIKLSRIKHPSPKRLKIRPPKTKPMRTRQLRTKQLKTRQLKVRLPRTKQLRARPPKIRLPRTGRLNLTCRGRLLSRASQSLMRNRPRVPKQHRSRVRPMRSRLLVRRLRLRRMSDRRLKRVCRMRPRKSPTKKKSHVSSKSHGPRVSLC